MINPKILSGRKLIAVFMGLPMPTIGSKWDYDRSLCHSKNTVGLVVEQIFEGGVIFEQPMAYTRYHMDYFDGHTFKPHGVGLDFPSTKIPYEKNFEEIMKVYKKWKLEAKSMTVLTPSLHPEFITQQQALNDAIVEVDHLVTFTLLCYSITWYNHNYKSEYDKEKINEEKNEL